MQSLPILILKLVQGLWKKTALHFSVDGEQFENEALLER